MSKLKDIHVTKRISTRATRYSAYMGNIENSEWYNWLEMTDMEHYKW